MHRGDALRAVALLLALSSAFADELGAVIPWEMLAQVSVTKQKDRYVPEFSKQITALDKREVKLKGFMLPLEQGLRHKRFLLSAQPPECAFCMPGTAEQFAEVLAKVPLKYMTEPIIVSGTFVLVRDDSGGLLYRLTEATLVEK
ncbi:MAG TPA: DUF3299 domain-containing protein [Burkholderiales bacterium]|nr:DUF3299 domain-containing protein [Burkholderiales bacterium]